MKQIGLARPLGLAQVDGFSGSLEGVSGKPPLVRFHPCITSTIEGERMSKKSDKGKDRLRDFACARGETLRTSYIESHLPFPVSGR